MNITLPLWSSIPFIILLCSISFMPGFFPRIWHKTENIIFIILSIVTFCVLWAYADINWTIDKLIHVIEKEYIPFIVVIYTLYTIGTGLKITIHGKPTPLKNALFLTTGGLLANLIGTTGMSMLLIHPFLKWNQHREHKTHLVLFFMFIVSNIGGSLTPLGDAPLFVGYILGVPFSWSFMNLLKISFFCQALLLILFIIVDSYKNKHDQTTPNHEKFSIQVFGKKQLIFIPFIIFILIYIDNEKFIPCFKEMLFLSIAFLSYYVDKKYDQFLSKKAHWSPVFEVARVFFAIFITLIPISVMLKSGMSGPFEPILKHVNANGVPDATLYFWLSGFFSAFLDNAPTYLLFYKMIGDFSAEHIIANFNTVLIAISSATIFFGALTYIGNAPNLMVKNIAKQHQIHMPSFLGYFFISSIILLPVFWIVAYLFIN
nr:sodium:proton antiporter [Pseudomonadota bacterium]